MLVNGIHHVSLNVSDTARALGFYRDLLGLVEVDRPDFPVAGAWLELADGLQVHLIESAVPADHGQHFALAVSDLDGALDEVRAVGFVVHGPFPVGDTGIRQAFVIDTDGNRVELTEPPA